MSDQALAAIMRQQPVSVDQRPHAVPLDHFVGTDRQAVALSPSLSDRQLMHRGLWWK
jgi:hypothetical protein